LNIASRSRSEVGRIASLRALPASALLEAVFGHALLVAVVLVGQELARQVHLDFLPYKYYGNEEGVPEYGFKES
jgi:hypothetical protein